jgi:hypothetical protein
MSTISTTQPSLSSSLTTQPAIETPVIYRKSEGLSSSFPENRAWLQGLVAKLAGSGSSVPEKEAAKAYNEFQSWLNAGPMTGRIENEKELNDLAMTSSNTPLVRRLELLANMESLASMKAVSNGTNPFTARLEFWKGVSETDREILASNYSVADKFGQREFKSLDQFYKVLEGHEGKFQEILSRPSKSGAPLNAKEVQAARASDAEWARRIQILESSKTEFSRRYGGISDIADTIQLSVSGSNAAAKTLATDSANDVALKALETLKQVNEQRREWANAAAEAAMQRDGDGQQQVASPNDPTKTAKPGTLVSIAA